VPAGTAVARKNATVLSFAMSCNFSNSWQKHTPKEFDPRPRVAVINTAASLTIELYAHQAEERSTSCSWSIELHCVHAMINAQQLLTASLTSVQFRAGKIWFLEIVFRGF